MKRIIGVSLVAVVSAALLVLFPTSKHGVPVAYAQSGCSVATLTGNYATIQPAGFVATGHSVTGAEVPWQVVGIITFDPVAGSASFSYSGAVNGKVFTSQTTSGTYTVNPDCTASLSFTSGDGAGYTANMVIIGSGAEIFGVATQTGDTASFDAKKQ